MMLAVCLWLCVIIPAMAVFVIWLDSLRTPRNPFLDGSDKALLHLANASDFYDL